MLRSVAYSCLPFTNTQCLSSRTRSVFHRGRRASFTAPGAFSVLETEWTREGMPTVPGTKCHSSRRGFSPFCSAPDAGGRACRSGHGVPFVAPWVFTVLQRAGRERSCPPFRARSAIRRAMGFHRSVARRTREGAPAVPGTECHSSCRGSSPSGGAPDAGARAACFIAPDAFSVLYTRRTREHAKRVSSHRMHSPFYTRAGRERARPPFRTRSVIRRGRRAPFIAHAQRVSSRRGVAPFCGAPDARAREACFIAPDAFSVLYTRRTREVTPPFRGRFGRHAQEYLCMIFQKRDFSFFKTEYSCKRSQF